MCQFKMQKYQESWQIIEEKNGEIAELQKQLKAMGAELIMMKVRV